PARKRQNLVAVLIGEPRVIEAEPTVGGSEERAPDIRDAHGALSHEAETRINAIADFAGKSKREKKALPLSPRSYPPGARGGGAPVYSGFCPVNSNCKRRNGFFPVLWEHGHKGRITMVDIIASTSFCAFIAGQFLAVVFAHKYRNAV